MRTYEAEVEIDPALVRDLDYLRDLETAMIEHTSSWDRVGRSVELKDERGTVNASTVDDAFDASDTSPDNYRELSLGASAHFSAKQRHWITWIRFSEEGRLTVARTILEGPNEVEVHGIAAVLNHLAAKHLERLEAEAAASDVPPSPEISRDHAQQPVVVTGHEKPEQPWWRTNLTAILTGTASTILGGAVLYLIFG